MATSPLFGWEEPDDTDLVKDGAAAIRTLGNAIDTSMGDLLGGTSGQVLSKNSNTNMDFTWVTSDDANAIQNAIVDAKGDLITATAADTPARLAVGTNGQTLVADSSTATGLKWATPAVSASGLTKIGSTNTFSSVASVTIDSIFSTTYKTYLVSFDNIYAATGADDLLMQLVYSGTAQTASYYGAVPYGTYDSASFGNIQNNNSSSFTLMQDCSGQYGDALTVWFQQVGNISQEGRFHGTGFSRQGVKAHTFGGAAAADRTYTGIKIFSSSTNITGNISVYGLA